jgi:hypothetical protein
MSISRKVLWVAVAIAVFATLSSCVLEVQVKGDVYIQYGWDTGVWDVADTNPAFLYVTAENQNYPSDTGTFYASYKTFFGGYYLFNYTLTADYVGSSDPYGPLSAYFYIYLSNSGPVLSDPVFYGRALSDQNHLGKLLRKSADAPPGVQATREQLGEPSGTLDKKVNGYTLHLEFWKAE